MTFLEAFNRSLLRAIKDPSVVVLGQLVKYGLAGMTAGVYERAPGRVLTFPVCENAMHGAAMGLALAGMRPVVINERMDFLALAMDPLVNHIPIWPYRAEMKLPVTVVAVVGKGKGQGPQHSKNLTVWFRSLGGWVVEEPNSPNAVGGAVEASIFGVRPSLIVLHREFFKSETEVRLPVADSVRLCGASKRHEEAFYGRSEPK